MTSHSFTVLGMTLLIMFGVLSIYPLGGSIITRAVSFVLLLFTLNTLYGD